MAPVKQKSRVHPSHKKRTGLHHNKGKHYVRVYWPYLPLIALIVLGLGISLPSRGNQRTLGYATNISQTTLLEQTNQQRASHHDEALKINQQLTQAAQAKANDMAQRGYWSHTTPEGNEPWYFVVNSGYAYDKAGENLAYGFTTSDETVSGWMNSPTHRANMLDAAFSDVGFGFANANNYQGHGNETIVVAMYGVPAAHAAQPSASGVYANSARPVSRLQSWTGDRMTWLSLMIGMMSGLAIMALLLKHGLALRKLVVEGETFFLHHPVLDVVLLALVVIGLFLGKTTGFII